jgi:hypothetical protein
MISSAVREFLSHGMEMTKVVQNAVKLVDETRTLSFTVLVYGPSPSRRFASILASIASFLTFSETLLSQTTQLETALKTLSKDMPSRLHERLQSSISSVSQTELGLYSVFQACLSVVAKRRQNLMLVRDIVRECKRNIAVQLREESMSISERDRNAQLRQ